MLRYRLVLFLVITGLMAQEKDSIIFSHLFHIEDIELDCETCHSNVNTSQSLQNDIILPEKDDCMTCHDDDTATEECEACHANPDDPLPFAESRSISEFKFSHKLHINSDKTCEQCHIDIAEDDGNAPRLKWQESNCETCHLSNPPRSHTDSWEIVHGMEVNIASITGCNMCHQQSTCDACHQVQQVEPKVHPASYLLSHGFDIFSGPEDCLTCHSIESDCRSCHKQNQIMPLGHNFPGWVTQSGGDHASDALNMPETCLVCHRPQLESSCLECH